MTVLAKVSEFFLCFLPALLLAAGIVGETGKMEYGALVIAAFAIGRLSK